MRTRSHITVSDTILSKFGSQLQLQTQVLRLIHSVLPEDLITHAQYCVISNQKILVYTDKAVWASQLRFYCESILKHINAQNQFKTIQQVQIRILMSEAIEHEPRSPIIPSAETTRLIRQAIQGSSDDPLSLALNHLCLILEKTLQK